jgi:hypothetical protein
MTTTHPERLHAAGSYMPGRRPCSAHHNLKELDAAACDNTFGQALLTVLELALLFLWIWIAVTVVIDIRHGRVSRG